MACLIGVIVESLMISPHFSSIEIPAVYRMLSADKSAGALLELPLGVRDGRKFWGEEFPAEILYYQTVHHHPIVGGYLSRVPDRIFSEYAKQPFLQQLILWQNNLPGNQVIEGNSFAAWAKDWKLSWILLDKNRAKGMLSDKISHLLGKPSYEDGSTIAWKIGDAG
jgi:hypothetical protein